MAPHDDPITALMIKYARREKLTEDEMRMLDAWCQESSENQKMAEDFGDLEWVRSELSKLKQAPMEEIWHGINQYLDEIGAPDDREKPSEWKEIAPHPRHRVWGWKTWVPMAAAVVVCVAGLWLLLNKQRVPETTNARPRIAESAAPPDLVAGDNEVMLTGKNGSKVDINAKPSWTTVWLTKSSYAEKTGSNQVALLGCDRGSEKNEEMRVLADGPEQQSDVVWQAVAVGSKCSPYLVRLPDSSKVLLAAGTRFWYPVANGRCPSTYIVDGKAYFDVKKDPSRPFTVKTSGGARIEVLGTSFLVETTKEKGCVVKLLTGKVGVHSGTGHRDLLPGQEAAAGSDRVDVRPMRDSANAMAWVESSRFFYFNNTQFTEAVAAVAAWYGFGVDNPKNLKGIPITDRLPKELAPEGVISLIGKIEQGVLYVWVKDRVIHISNKPPPRR